MLAHLKTKFCERNFQIEIEKAFVQEGQSQAGPRKGPKAGPKVQKLKVFLCYLLQYKALTGPLRLVGRMPYLNY